MSETIRTSTAKHVIIVEWQNWDLSFCHSTIQYTDAAEKGPGADAVIVPESGDELVRRCTESTLGHP